MIQTIDADKLDTQGGQGVLVYGSNGTGKTTLVRRLPATVLYLDIDQSREVIKGCVGVKVIGPITTTADLDTAGEMCFRAVEKYANKIRWIVVDSATILQGRYERLNRHRYLSDAKSGLSKWDVFTIGADEIMHTYEQWFTPARALGVNVLTFCNVDTLKDAGAGLVYKGPALNVSDFRVAFINWHGRVGRLRVEESGQRVIDWNAGADYIARDRSVIAPDTSIPEL